MGFSLRNLFNDTVAQVNPFDHGQSAATNQQQRQLQAPAAPSRNLQPAVTPPPGRLPIAAPTSTIAPNTAQPFNLRSMLNGSLNPSVVPNPILATQQPAPVQQPLVPKNATQIYHDKAGNVLGWEDPTGSHLTPAGQAAAPKNGDTRSGASKVFDQLNPFDNGRSFKQEGTSNNGSIIHQATHNGVTNGVGQAVFKPLENIVTGDIVEPGRSLVAQATGNNAAYQAAEARAAADQAASLPQTLVRSFARTGEGLAYTPKAIYREIQNKPITDIQQRVYGTSDSGSLAKEIIGDTAQELLTVGAPVAGKVAGTAAAPVIDDLANPVVQKLATAAVHAGTQAPIGAGFGVASTESTNPNATAADLKKAAGTSALTFAALGTAGDAAGALKDSAPKLIDYASTHADTIKSLQGNEVGAVGKDVRPTPADQPLPATPKKTGILDPQMQDIQRAKQSVVNTAADELLQSQKGATDIHGQIRQAGGISASDHEGLPSVLKNKNGLPMDEMAANLGFSGDQALMDAIDNQTAAGKPLTRTEARAQVQQQLEQGQHPYSSDYAQMTAAEKARADELSQYPKGTRSQVKVTDNKVPASMSEAEFQSLANQPEAQIKPAGNKVPVINDKNVIRNADAERSVMDGLQKGTPTDTILTQYQKDTGVTLQQAVKDVNRVAKEANIETNLGKNPLLDAKNKDAVKALPSAADGNWKQATLNSRFVQYKEQAVGHQALDAYNGLSPHDQVLLKQIENKTVSAVAKSAENPAAFKAADQALRTYFDTRHAYDTNLGIDVGYRTNYIRHFFDKAQEADLAPPTGDEQLSGGGANKAPGYTKARTVEALAKNVGDALERDIGQSSFNHAKLAYENGLNEAFPGKIANGEIPRSGNDGKYVQIDHPFGNDLSAPKDIAHEINSRTWHQNDSKALNTYDTINHGLKYVKLSGGLYHAFTESGNFLGQQFASGKILTDPGATAKLAQIFFSDKAMHNEVARMADTGVLDKAQMAGLQVRSDQILADANVKSLDRGANFKPSDNPVAKARDLATKFTGIQAMHDATFQREIPYAKLKIFEQKTEGLDPNVPADMAKIRQTADGINNVFGGINREVQGIKPDTFKWLQRRILATDFTEGKFHTLSDAISKWGADNPQGRTARQVVAGKAILFGLLATAGAAAGGGYRGKSVSQIAKDAAGNLVDPQFEMGGYKVGLPKTHISEVVDALKPTNKTGKAWNASGLLSYVQNRSAALPSEAIQLLTNKNYYGQPLYGTNTKKNGGTQISAPQAGLNVAQTVLPIPFGQVTNTVSGKQNPAAAAANIIGFKAKPNPDNSQTFQGVNVTLNDKQSENYQASLKANTDKLTSQLTSSDAYKNANPNDRATMLSQLKSNITSATQRDYASKNNLGQFDPNYKGKGSQASTKEQDVLSGTINPDAYVPNSGNSDSAAVAAFKKGNARSTTIGNDTYYKTKDGTVKKQSTFDYGVAKDSSKIALNLDLAKSNDNYPAWKDSAQQKYQLLQKQINNLDPQTESAKVDDLTKQANDLVNQMRTYASYGGQFTKPPKGKTGRQRALSTNGITYKVYDPSSLNKSLASLVASARA